MSDAAIKRQEWQHKVLWKQSSILVIFFPRMFLKSNLGNAAPIFGKATFGGLSSRSSERCLHACCIKHLIQNSQPCINLPCPTMSSGKVWKWIMQMTICCVPFVFSTQQVWTQLHLYGARLTQFCQRFGVEKLGLAENNAVCLQRRHSHMMVFPECNVCLVWFV